MLSHPGRSTESQVSILWNFQLAVADLRSRLCLCTHMSVCAVNSSVCPSVDDPDGDDVTSDDVDGGGSSGDDDEERDHREGFSSSFAVVSDNERHAFGRLVRTFYNSTKLLQDFSHTRRRTTTATRTTSRPRSPPSSLATRPPRRESGPSCPSRACPTSSSRGPTMSGWGSSWRGPTTWPGRSPSGAPTRTKWP